MKYPVFGANETTFTGTATSYHSHNPGANTAAQSTESLASVKVAGAFTLTNFYMRLFTAPGSGKSWVYTVMKNGVATDLTLTIAGTATEGTDSVNSVSFATGDTISIRAVPSGTPANSMWSASFLAEGDYQVVGGRTTVNMSNSATRYINFLNSTQVGVAYKVTDNEAAFICPANGTFSYLRADLNGTPGSGKSYAFTLHKNGVDTALTTTVADVATTATDSTNSVAVTAGDRISMKIVPSGTPTARQPTLGLRFTPAVGGTSIFGFSSNNNGLPSLGWTNGYNVPLGTGFFSFLSAETNTKILAPGDYKISSLWARANDNFTSVAQPFFLRKNSVDTALTVSCATSGTVYSSINEVAFSPGDVLTLRYKINSSTQYWTSLNMGWSVLIAGAIQPDLIPSTSNVFAPQVGPYITPDFLNNAGSADYPEVIYDTNYDRYIRVTDTLYEKT